MARPYTDYRGENTFMICSKCGGRMMLKEGTFGHYYACGGYPNCKNTMGCYSTPDEVSFLVFAMNQAFSPFIKSFLPTLKDAVINVTFLDNSHKMTDKEAGFFHFTDEGFDIRINQHYNFRTKFDILEFLIKRYATAWYALSHSGSDYVLCKTKYVDEKHYIDNLADDNRKVFYAKTIIKSAEISDKVFEHVFGILQKPAEPEINYPF